MGERHKYMSIVNWTIAQVSEGNFLPGARFLSEHQLTQRFSCSRQTVRRALEVLEQRGVVKRIQGSGTFISDSAQYPTSDQPRSMTVGLIVTYMDTYIFPPLSEAKEMCLASKDTGCSSHGLTTQWQVRALH